VLVLEISPDLERNDHNIIEQKEEYYMYCIVQGSKPPYRHAHTCNEKIDKAGRFHAEIGLVPGWGKARPDVDPRQKATGYR
jgi:hypothetical protein